jgi:hypothetical protein
MFLIVDEIANLSSDHTLLVYGSLFNWFDFPRTLRLVGPQAFQLPFQPQWDIVLPATADPQTIMPSTAVARQLVPVRNSAVGIWPPAMGQSPAFAWGSVQWPLCKFTHEDLRQAIAIVRSDGTVVFTVIQLLTYLAIEPYGPLPIGTKGSLAAVGVPLEKFPMPANWGAPLNHALRLSTWVLDEKDAAETMQVATQRFYGIDDPGSLPTPKTRTILFSQQWTLRDMLDDRYVPSAPMQHLRIGVGDTLLLRAGPARDFTGDEIAYENEEAARRPMTLWQALADDLMILYQIALAAAQKINWQNLLTDDAIVE